MGKYKKKKILTRTDNKENQSLLTSQSSVEKSKRRIELILISLKASGDTYNEEKTLYRILDYLENDSRIVYSAVTSSIYGMREDDRGTLLSNLEIFIGYLEDKERVEEKIKNYNSTHTTKENSTTSQSYQEVKNASIKLWDHVNLAIQQMNYASLVLQDSVTEVEEHFSEKFTGMERDYVAILGIFASIVLTFTGGIAFSTSVLANMHSSSVYRVAMTILLIGLVLINVMYLLYNCVYRITRGDKQKDVGQDNESQNSKASKKKNTFGGSMIGYLNAGILVLLAVVFMLWCCGAVESRNDRVFAPDKTIVVETENSASLIRD